MDLKIDWWLSLLLAIPFGIAANLLTPKLQAAIERLSETGKRRQAEAEAETRRRVLRYVSDMPALYIYLLGVGIRIGLLSAAQSICNSVVSVVPDAFEVIGRPGRGIEQIFHFATIVDSAFRLMIALAIFELCKNALVLIRCVLNERKTANKRPEANGG